MKTQPQFFTHHPREWQDFTWVYPVISRRAKGLSIGINLNVDGQCNFDCVYCCVDRSQAIAQPHFDPEHLRFELESLFKSVQDGTLWNHPRFCDVPLELRAIRDISFAGNGEPTLHPQFGEACRVVREVQSSKDFFFKVQLFSNATLLSTKSCRDALMCFDPQSFEIWAKLDNGDVDSHHKISRTLTRLEIIQKNIVELSQLYTTKLQSMWFESVNTPFSEERRVAYIDFLKLILSQEAHIAEIQLYTIARSTAESDLSTLSREDLELFKRQINFHIPQVACQIYT